MPSHIHSTTKVHRIALIPGDGIGTEITTAAVRALRQLSATLSTFTLDFTQFPWSSATYLQEGHYMPSDGLAQLKKFDAIYFGAVGWPDVPDHISLWGLILPIRKTLGQYVNVRPVRMLDGVTSPLKGVQRAGDLDWVIVRENSEGEYSGQGGISHEDELHGVATEVSVFTRVGVERVVRFAFEVARGRPRRKLTMVTKSNAQRHGMVFWDKVFWEVAREFPDVETDKMLVDAMTVRMTLDPKSLDTIVATNLHADILSDLAAALAGSIGIAPSSNLNPERTAPSMFEPIHGSAPDIAGKGVANPVGAFWSAAEMVRWLGEDKAADVLMEAVENVTRAGVTTKDLGGKENTEGVTEAVHDIYTMASAISVPNQSLEGNSLPPAYILSTSPRLSKR
ncbi:tartrate dehydrogenase/decarboxylase [Periconia macrospinosa]|uniref:D-malate dehydrogenase (decarboxylating) n=1 Tax=Periconia macrospinosa TaxID=97972 RepID=A0A2V1DSB3_9PLEO|nr:tartrate dehydrogenase/decarboxylase [Periconia macrospinosa]